MADFSQPVNGTLYSLVLGLLKDTIAACVVMLDGTTDTNLPNGAKRYNSTNNKFEKYSSSGGTWSTLGFHTAIDNHIADTSLHAGIPTGGIIAYGGAAAPTNYLLCQGGAFSRATYSALFAIIGTTFGSGDGSTTFNVPDARQRFLLGKAASGTGSSLGQTGGAIDHTHSVPNHSHAIAAHTHTMGNHTHATPNHTHPIASHTHVVPGHGHSTTHVFASIATTGGGAHNHTYGAKEGGTLGSGADKPTGAATSGTNVTYTTNTTNSSHVHAHAEFTGTVGAWNGGGTGVSGDGNITTDGGTLTVTNSGGAGTSDPPSTNTTDPNSTALTTATDGASTTGSNNAPFLVVNWIIRI